MLSLPSLQHFGFENWSLYIQIHGSRLSVILNFAFFSQKWKEWKLNLDFSQALAGEFIILCIRSFRWGRRLIYRVQEILIPITNRSHSLRSFSSEGSRSQRYGKWNGMTKTMNGREREGPSKSGSSLHSPFSYSILRQNASFDKESGSVHHGIIHVILKVSSQDLTFNFGFTILIKFLRQTAQFMNNNTLIMIQFP